MTYESTVSMLRKDSLPPPPRYFPCDISTVIMLRKDSLPPPPCRYFPLDVGTSYYAEEGPSAPTPRYFPPDISTVIMLRKDYPLPRVN